MKSEKQKHRSQCLKCDEWIESNTESGFGSRLGKHLAIKVHIEEE